MDKLFELDRASLEALRKSCAQMSVCLEALTEAVKQYSMILSQTWETIKESVQSALEGYFSQMGPELSNLLGVYAETYWDFVPPKIRHLAFHHPKARVRNKNWNRMWKIHKRYMQCKQ